MGQLTDCAMSAVWSGHPVPSAIAGANALMIAGCAGMPTMRPIPMPVAATDAKFLASAPGVNSMTVNTHRPRTSPNPLLLTTAPIPNDAGDEQPGAVIQFLDHRRGRQNTDLGQQAQDGGGHGDPGGGKCHE